MKKIRIEDIAKFAKGKQINGNDLLEKGKYVFLNGGINPSGMWDEYNVSGNTVTVSEGGNSCGYVNFMQNPFWCGAHCYYFYEIGCEPRFLYYALKANEDKIMKLRSGACMPNIKMHALGNFQIVYYEDIKEQNHIVSILDSVQSLLTHYKQQLELLDTLVKARFVEMFGNPVLNDKGWELCKTGDIITFQGGSQPDKSYFEYRKRDGNIRLIQIRDYKTDKYVTYIPIEKARRFCEADDIMIGRYGPPIFQVLSGIKGAYNVALMKAIPQRGNREFARQFLKQECLLRYLEGLSGRTAGQDGVDMKKLKEYPFPFPPIELQNQFASFVQQVEKTKEDVRKGQERAQMLFDSLMQEYFG